MKDRKHIEGMADLFAGEADFAGRHLDHVCTEGEPADQATAMRQWRAAIAAGLASGPGRPAEQVFQRLEAKYRNQADGESAD